MLPRCSHDASTIDTEKGAPRHPDTPDKTQHFHPWKTQGQTCETNQSCEVRSPLLFLYKGTHFLRNTQIFRQLFSDFFSPAANDAATPISDHAPTIPTRAAHPTPTHQRHHPKPPDEAARRLPWATLPQDSHRSTTANQATSEATDTAPLSLRSHSAPLR